MIVPPQRPKITREEAERIQEALGLANTCIIGIRGYYGETFQPSGNNRGVYDDCILVLAPSYTGLKPVFKAFNANTDPSVFRKGVATLNPGVWSYKKGPHPLIGGYPALRQAEKVTVSRDGQEKTQTAFLGINVHKGSYTKTSSLGCQTIHPDQWREFITTVYTVMGRADIQTIEYALVTQDTMREILG